MPLNTLMLGTSKRLAVLAWVVSALVLPSRAVAQVAPVAVPTVPGAPGAAQATFGNAAPLTGRATTMQAPGVAGPDFGAAAPSPAMPSSTQTPSLNRPSDGFASRSGTGSPEVPGAKPTADSFASPAKGSDDDARRVQSLRVTEFQRFVFETSGRALPLFGYNFFAGGRFNAATNAPVPSDYLIGPGDEIRLTLWGAVDADLRLTVDRDGQVSVPKVGTINLTGVRATQLESVLRAQIGRMFRGFQLSATLGPLRSIQVFVVGQANQPGTYLVSGASTLVSALFDSGGPAATGSLRGIQLKRDGKVVSTIDLYRFIAQGEKAMDIKLLSGDVIVIPPAGPRVAVLGAVDTPAIYELKSAQESLGDLLAYGGGTLAITSPQKAVLERVDPSVPSAQRTVEERTLDAPGLKSTVRDGDILTLFKISPQFTNAVTLRGNVAAPLRYPYRAGMRISDLIPEREALIRPEYYQSKNMMVQFESGLNIGTDRVMREVRNLLEEVNWDYALVERLDAKAVRSQLIPFNLGRAVLNRDPADDLLLLPGDVVTVFGVNDVPVPMEKRTQFVRLGGEVKVPGLYQIQAGETLPQLVVRAGGFTGNAFVYGTEFYRESTRKQQQTNLDLAVRRYESEVMGTSIFTLQNTRDDQAAGLQGQLASQQMLLSRLKALKATGRVALDLEAARPALPAIVLEDGDVVTVPYPPSFVGVFGAVLTERSLVHRPNYRVNDYLQRAGLTRFADDDATMIIRADGTIESNAQKADSFFSYGAGMGNRDIYPGDSIFIPEKLDRETGYNRFVRGLKDWTSIFYQFGLGAAAIRTLNQ